MIARHLFGLDLRRAKTIVAENHYLRSVPSGKTLTFECGDAIVIIGISSNQFLPSFLGFDNVWELSRMWAPDGHEKNLLTIAISKTVALFREMEPTVDALISYADPSAGHHGGIYRAASWYPFGQVEESRLYRAPDGRIVPRRAFHSSKKFLRKAEILALGYTETEAPGKLRFVKPLTPKARRAWRKRIALPMSAFSPTRAPAVRKPEGLEPQP